MERTISLEAPSKKGEKILVKGWLHSLRLLGSINFLILRDRGGLIQIVIQDKTELEKVKDLQPGSIIAVEGEVQESSQTELGIELINPSINIEVAIKDVPPVEYSKPEIKADLETILDYRTITLRNRKIAAVFKIQGEIAHAYRTYMHDSVGATEYFGPNMIGASSEGGAEFFNIDYFGNLATLAQSNQLYKQVMVGVYERVFAIMPFFRAENSNTVRHLTEGKQLEFEMGFFESWEEVMDIEEGFIKYMIEHLEKTCKKELELLDGQIIKAPKDKKFPRLTYKEAQEVYFKRTGIDDRAEEDLSPAAEKELCKYASEEFGTDCIFITYWKTSKRPFYSYVNDENSNLTNTFDLLCAGTEITSGGQRAHTYETMVEGIKRKGMNPSSFEDYLNIFKFGMPAHGGFGLGLERLTMTVLKLQNIREASLFPSDPKRIAGTRIKTQAVKGGDDMVEKIKTTLTKKGIEFKHIVHEPTPTSEDAARVRETKMEQGIKAIILKGKKSGNNAMACVPAHLKLDMKALSEIVGEALTFEDPAVIKEKFGLIIGGVPPFGNLLGIPTYYDKKILDEEKAVFNAGLQTESVLMKSKDLIDAVGPILGDFAK